MPLLSELSDTILRKTSQMSEVVDPHSCAGIACIDSHADVVDEKEVMSKEHSVGE